VERRAARCFYRWCSIFLFLFSKPVVSCRDQALVWNRDTEYPATINAIQRFNIYPEVALAVMHKAWEDVWGYLGFDFRADWVHCFLLGWCVLFTGVWRGRFDDFHTMFFNKATHGSA
jgi:hypothetical protein